MSTFHPAPESETIELQQQVVRLQALLEASRQVHSTIKLEEVQQTVLRIVVRELEMPGALFTEPPLEYGTVPVGKWEECARFPLRDREGNLLTELVVAPQPGALFTLSEQDFLEGLALQAAVAMENARHSERDVQWARVQQDLDAARVIQRSLLPETMPSIPGYSVAVRSSPCYEVGGDYLDIIELSSGEQIMVVADVAGKGLASAIVSTSFRSAFRAMARSGLPLTELAARLNQQHWDEGPESRRRYVTTIILKLDCAAHRLEVVNAGHNPGFLVAREGGPRLIEASGTPLGLMAGGRYKSEGIDFAPGDRLLFYTDGLTDVFRGDEEFGTERLLSEFESCTERDCGAMLDFLWNKLAEFGEGSEQADDMTALALQRSAQR